MPPSIVELAGTILTEPVQVEVVPESTPAERIVQRVLFVDSEGKKEVIGKLVSDPRVERALLFTRTKHRANRLVQQLERQGIRAAALHGNKSQSARQRALEEFRAGTTPVLVATDIAARGLDIEGIAHVVNFEVPDTADTYVHRVGRTGRSGATGHAVTLVSPAEERAWRAVEQAAGIHVG